MIVIMPLYDKKIEAYIDCGKLSTSTLIITSRAYAILVLPYSFYLFSYLRENRCALETQGVEVE